jgi:hypothetical protein
MRRTLCGGWEWNRCSAYTFRALDLSMGVITGQKWQGPSFRPTLLPSTLKKPYTPLLHLLHRMVDALHLQCTTAPSGIPIIPATTPDQITTITFIHAATPKSPINKPIPPFPALTLIPELSARLGLTVATLPPLVVVGFASAVTTLVNVEVCIVPLVEMLSVVKVTEVVALGNRDVIEVRV